MAKVQVSGIERPVGSTNPFKPGKHSWASLSADSACASGGPCFGTLPSRDGLLQGAIAVSCLPAERDVIATTQSFCHGGAPSEVNSLYCSAALAAHELNDELFTVTMKSFACFLLLRMQNSGSVFFCQSS